MERSRVASASASICGWLTVVVAAAAQNTPPAPQADRSAASAQAVPPEGTKPSQPAASLKDIFDILRELRHKPPQASSGADDYKKLMIAAAPVISYNPSSGFGLGAAGNIAFYRGPPQTTRMSSGVGSLIVTSKGQVLVNAKFNVSLTNNAWSILGDNRLYWTSQDTYGLGTSTTPSDAVNMKYSQFRFFESVCRRVAPSLYLGAGFLYTLHTDVRPADDFASVWPDSPYVTYSTEHGFDLDSQTSAGASVQGLFDSRDSVVNPSRGWYAGIDYLMFWGGFLGGTSSWQQVNYDLRTYLRLSNNGRHSLALWSFGNLVTGGVAPYLHLPATAMDTYGRSGRGYVQGRFRGQQLLYGEAEYRWTVTRNGLFGIVAFLNTQTLSDKQTGERLFDSLATGGGAGLRLLINKRSKTNLCLDFGLGRQGSSGVYFGVQEAF
jgi:hypothetical protein